MKVKSTIINNIVKLDTHWYKLMFAYNLVTFNLNKYENIEISLYITIIDRVCR